MYTVQTQSLSLTATGHITVVKSPLDQNCLCFTSGGRGPKQASLKIRIYSIPRLVRAPVSTLLGYNAHKNVSLQKLFFIYTKNSSDITRTG